MEKTPKRNEPDPKVVEARQCLEASGIPCRIAYGGHAVLLRSAATYAQAKKILEEKQHDDVPVYLPATSASPQPIPAKPARKEEVKEPVTPTEGATALTALLAEKRIPHRLSERDGNVVYITDPQCYREANALRNGDPRIASVSLFIRGQ